MNKLLHLIDWLHNAPDRPACNVHVGLLSGSERAYVQTHHRSDPYQPSDGDMMVVVDVGDKKKKTYASQSKSKVSNRVIGQLLDWMEKAYLVPLVLQKPNFLSLMTSWVRSDPNTTARLSRQVHGVIASPLSPSAPPGRSEVVGSIVGRAASSCQ